MNACQLSGVIDRKSVHITDNNEAVTFTLYTCDGINARHAYEDQIHVPCVIVSPSKQTIEGFRECKDEEFVELCGRVQLWLPNTVKRREPVAYVIADESSVTFFKS